VALATAGVRDCQVNATPETGAFRASRASALSSAESPREANWGAVGVMTTAPMRVRRPCVLDTFVGVPLRTACAVMVAVPRRTPLTRPLLETVARVVSLEVHTNVTPVVRGLPPAFATAVSCRVPLSTTVESPLIVTEVIVGGPPSPPPLPHALSTAATAPTRIGRKGFMVPSPAKRLAYGLTMTVPVIPG